MQAGEAADRQHDGDETTQPQATGTKQIARQGGVRGVRVYAKLNCVHDVQTQDASTRVQTLSQEASSSGGVLLMTRW